MAEVVAKGRTASVGKDSKGKMQVSIEFYALRGPRDLVSQTYVWYGSFAGDAPRITLEQLAHTGFSGNFHDMRSCLQNEVRLTLENQENGNGLGSERKGFWRVKSIRPLERRLFKDGQTATPDDIAALQAAFGTERAREPGDDDDESSSHGDSRG